MPGGLTIFYPLLLVGVACLAAIAVWRLRQRYPTTARRRAQMARHSVVYVAIVVLAMFVLNLLDQRPFWPREAISLLCWSIVLGCLFYSWRAAERKAALEPPSPPERPEPPRFIWQATLILMPVLIMTVVGWNALRRDRAAVENEARQRAEELIERLQDSFGRRVASELSWVKMFAYQWKQHQTRSRGGWPDSEERAEWDRVSTNYYPGMVAEWQQRFPGVAPESLLPNQLTFDAEGMLQWPTPADLPPQPPGWYRALTPEQLAGWLALRAAEASVDGAGLSNAVVSFLATAPPEAAEVNARFLQLRHEGRQLEAQLALPRLRAFTQRYQHVPSESGLPLASLVFAEMLRHSEVSGPNETLWRELGRQVEAHASALTPLILDRAEALVRTNDLLRDSLAAWRLVWLGNERARAIAAAIQQTLQLQPLLTTNLWVEHAGQNWFCILSPTETQTHTHADGVAISMTNTVTRVDFFPQSLIELAFRNALREPRSPKPDYFGYTVALENRPLTPIPPDRPAASRATWDTPLAVGSFHLWQPGTMDGRTFETLPSHPQFILRVHLADPARLFATYRQRLGLFGGLIGVSAIVALIGVVMARRAFLREQRLNTLKSSFVSSVSHELRAPIAAVRLLAESLERGKIAEPEKQQEYFRFIGQECRRLSALIENVLDFARIEQGRKQYEFEPTDLGALVEQTVTLMQPYATERGVSLKCELRSAKCEVELDGRAIQQALVNLIDNAIKHSPKDAIVSVALETPTLNSQPSTLNLSVSDSGPGIPASEHEKIFERFHRLGSELRRETPGVGIGLSIVKHIVEAHGGRVRVESEVGQGSRFTMELANRAR